MKFMFPKIKFADTNTEEEQLGHIHSEVDEIFLAEAFEDEHAFHRELADLQHSIETYWHLLSQTRGEGFVEDIINDTEEKTDAEDTTPKKRKRPPKKAYRYGGTEKAKKVWVDCYNKSLGCHQQVVITEGEDPRRLCDNCKDRETSWEHDQRRYKRVPWEIEKDPDLEPRTLSREEIRELERSGAITPINQCRPAGGMNEPGHRSSFSWRRE